MNPVGDHKKERGQVKTNTAGDLQKIADEASLVRTAPAPIPASAPVFGLGQLCLLSTACT